ncbi:MAG: hypothetical protein K9J37_09245 [Saprospiraceae bacterium]|nr:hypothetical protein [Saprospiraceae bacterium]MCF8250088.1 hypothetical protein [Saprospiraceae bacterium]MCF8279550.1 hypothetical protein [Bacteroidales bacterium]MCF8311946.1 hypothetical protein [Saprospiraceae bacterium]MCF8440364.1 hypothetical protein [Saprospiraceae bacterium]
MNTRFVPATLLAIALLLSSCQRPLIVDDDSSGPDAAWELVDYKSNAYIQGLYATPFELYVITENTFARLDANLEIIEKREFPVSNSLPAMSDNVFVRLTTNAQNRQVIEFNLARTASEIFRVQVDTLPTPTGNSLDIEPLTNTLGAFSADGTLFLMAARVLPARYYALYLFDIKLNVQHNSFVSVKMVKRIDLTDLDANVDGAVKSIKFQGGNFYLATQQGAWRITPTGVASKQFAQWKEDCFSWLGDLYMTGTVDYDLDKSVDNGLSWERMNFGSELRHVTVADTVIFTQTLPGKYFGVIPKDFKKAKAIVYPSGTALNTSLFYGLAYFNDRYYFSIDKDIYVTDKVKTN